MQVTVHKNRDHDFSCLICGEDGSATQILAADIVYLKVGNSQDTPLFEMDSTAETSAGSSITASNPTDVKLRQADVNSLQAGIYDLEIGFLDASDSYRMKHAQKGVLVIHGLLAGNANKTQFEDDS